MKHAEGDDAEPTTASSQAPLTVERLRRSGLIGIWRDRSDIQDSSEYARQLREQAQRRAEVSFVPAVETVQPYAKE